MFPLLTPSCFKIKGKLLLADKRLRGYFRMSQRKDKIPFRYVGSYYGLLIDLRDIVKSSFKNL